MAESREFTTHASISLNNLSLDSSIFLESLKDSKRNTASDDEIVRLDDTRISVVTLGRSGDESAGDGDDEVEVERVEAPKFTEIGLDDTNNGKVVGLIFEAFGLRNSPVIRPERTVPQPIARKKAKTTSGKPSKTAMAPQKVKGPASTEGADEAKE
ncbi:hypothetical protein AVEN_62853-1 [Araneus ventricosus]|uniref:Uncharacterized protein n=1 Tax=Araneus ventricosus TaxID=182803 RepID=A0A4Y2QV10_ARAVE|nr:hypothetical protein AVEN_62853-1 [Araneus ventricosus]